MIRPLKIRFSKNVGYTLDALQSARNHRLILRDGSKRENRDEVCTQVCKSTGILRYIRGLAMHVCQIRCFSLEIHIIIMDAIGWYGQLHSYL
jgi:hypothetical protein